VISCSETIDDPDFKNGSEFVPVTREINNDGLLECLMEEIGGNQNCNPWLLLGCSFQHPNFGECELIVEPVVYVCVNLNGTTNIYVGELYIFSTCPEFQQAIDDATINGTLDEFYISLNSHAYPLVHEKIKENFSVFGGIFIETTYSISSCVSYCGKKEYQSQNPDNLSPSIPNKIDCGQECCKRVLRYREVEFDQYEEISDVFFSPERPCEDNFECTEDVVPYFNSTCTGQCETISGF